MLFASPVYAQCRSRFRDFTKAARTLGDEWIASINKSELRVELVNGSAVTFASVFESDRLRGEGLDLVILDECGYVDAPVWNEVLRPMLADRGGRSLAVGSPHGKGQLLHTLYLRGQAGEDDWRSWRFKTQDNPRIAREELRAARRELPQDVYRQEYEAEFLESAAGVFRNIAACIGGRLSGPVPTRRYIVGVDLAQVRDWSVIIVLEAGRRQVVDFQRFRGSYVDQVSRILETAQRYNHADLVIDETGVGRPVLDAIRATLGRPRQEESNPSIERSGGLLPNRVPKVTGMTPTSQSKQDLIQRHQIAVERAQVHWPEECREITHEHEVYGYEMTKSGRVAYSAPSGFHDDCVIALALACFAVPREGFDFSHVPEGDWDLIQKCAAYVRKPGRYGLSTKKVPGLYPLGPSPETDEMREMRLLQLAEANGLISEDEAEVLAEDLRRRIQERQRYAYLGGRNPFAKPMGYRDQLEHRFGTLGDFLAGGSRKARSTPDDDPEAA